MTRHGQNSEFGIRNSEWRKTPHSAFPRPASRQSRGGHIPHCASISRGQTLIIVLWVMGLLTVAVGALTMRSTHEVRLGHIPHQALQRKAIAQAGLAQAIAVLKRDDVDGLRVDHLAEAWSTGIDEESGAQMLRQVPVGSGIFSVELVDEESTLNVNLATADQLRALIEAVQPGGGDAQATAAAIIDWRDETVGAVCEAAEPACHNALLQTMDELRLVPGMTPVLFQALEPHMTIYGSGRVNVNTASAIVLDAFGCPGAALVAQRESEPFSAPPDVCPDAVVSSSVFAVSVLATVGQATATQPVVAILDRNGCLSDQPNDPCILAWHPQD